MNYKEKLSHSEKSQAIADCLRDIMAVEISNRNMPNLLNRGKAIAALITADQREEIMEAKRQAVQVLALDAGKKEGRKLRKVTEPRKLKSN